MGGSTRPAHPGRYLRITDAALAFWRALQDYHRLIVEDDVRAIPRARQALKRARRKLTRAHQWGVTYDQVPVSRVRDDAAWAGRLPELSTERDAHA